MKYKKIFIIILTIVILIIVSFKLYSYLRVKFAKIEVILVEDMTLEFSDKKRVSDYISSINGNIIDDYVIDSTVLGNKEVTFKFINEDNIKLTYTYNLNIVDTIEPLIWLGSSYSVVKDSSINLEEVILCGDNYDNNPNCFIEGDYDTSTVGDYELVFKAIDNSGNISIQPFTLKVHEPVKDNYIKKSYTNFTDVINNYKNDNTKIGIDVSHWQGDIDFEKIKNAGVEFIMIRIGTTDKISGEYILDEKFKYNISKANKYGIKAGIYFYSYADTIEKSKKDAEWVISQIENYDIDLWVAFDWEEWKNFNQYHLSFFGLNNIANEFINTIEGAGYESILYGSKNYLESIWDYLDSNVWLAHYTKETNYNGKYKLWQICDDGVIDGINGYVDIDIMYDN